MATTASPSSLAARTRGLVLALAAAAVAFPIAVLTHELGHFLVYLLVGVPGLELHFGSVSFAGSEAFWEHIRMGDQARAAQIAPVAGVAAAIAAGLAISYVTVLACAVLASRGNPHPFVAGLGLAASLRFFPVALAALVLTLRGQPLTGNIDELKLALLTGVPATFLAILGAIWALGAWFLILRALLRRRRDAVTVVAGVALGGFLYIGVIGPLLLP